MDEESLEVVKCRRGTNLAYVRDLYGLLIVDVLGLAAREWIRTRRFFFLN